MMLPTTKRDKSECFLINQSHCGYYSFSKFMTGQSMVEFIIIFPMLILLTLGTFQLALIYNAKNTLNYAIFNAARKGAVNYADKRIIEKALYRGLSPLFTTVEMGEKNKEKKVQSARDKVKSIHQDGFLCIERVNPSTSAFFDFGKKNGMIPNDNLMYRSASVGSTSLISIQDANLLKLRVSYCHRLIVPFFPRMLQLMVNGTDPDGVSINTDNNLFFDNCYANGRIPIVSQAIVRMQSAIKNDTFPDCKSPLP